MMFAARGGHLELVHFLLAKGVAIDERNKENATALYIAAREGHAQVVAALLKAGASVAAATQTKRTAMHW